MALAQRTRAKLSTRTKEETRQKQGTFSALFPEQGIKDATLSAHCMKKLLVVGVSSIAYLRNMFPNSAFGDRAIEDMSLKILRERSQSPEACQVVAWLKNIFPAIENRYVNKVVVGVYDGGADPDALTQEDLIETHTFKFGSINHADYIKITTSQNQTLKLPTSADFKANSINLLRTLLMTTQALDKLPEVCLLALKVYYDDSVPEDFTLDGFEEVAQRNEKDPFSVPRDSRVKIEVGGTATHHDALKVYVQTNRNRFETVDEHAPQGAPWRQQEQEEEDNDKEKETGEEAPREREEQGLEMKEKHSQQLVQQEEVVVVEGEGDKKKRGTHGHAGTTAAKRARPGKPTKKSKAAAPSTPPRTRSQQRTRSSKNKKQQQGDLDPFGFEEQHAEQGQQGQRRDAVRSNTTATVEALGASAAAARATATDPCSSSSPGVERSASGKEGGDAGADNAGEEDDGACTPPPKKANLLLLKTSAMKTRRGLNSSSRSKQQRRRSKDSRGSEETVVRATAQDATQFDAYEFCDSQDEAAIQKKGKKRGKRRSTVVKRPVRLTTRARSRK